MENQQEKAVLHAKIVNNTLIKAGFVVNSDKTDWVPSQKLTWLGFTVDTQSQLCYVTPQRILRIQSTIAHLIANPITTARKLAAFTGSLISTKFVLGDIVSLQTRSLYQVITQRKHWDNKIHLENYESAQEEILFWERNLSALNLKGFSTAISTSHLHCYSDASDKALGVVFNDLSCHRNLSSAEQVMSSAWRELKAIQFGLQSFAAVFQGKVIIWYTDNFACTAIITKGSPKEPLQRLALSVYHLAKLHNIDLTVKWIPREKNVTADKLSKYLDVDDWETTDSFFHLLSAKWGPFTIDRFASQANKKIPRFNSKFFSPGSEGINAFAQPWDGEHNFLVPPVRDIIGVIRKITVEHVHGVLVVPLWTSSAFWPLLLEGGRFKSFITHSKIFKEGKQWLKPGNSGLSLLGAENFTSSLIALKIES